jgi:hypothetical protein
VSLSVDYQEQITFGVVSAKSWPDLNVALEIRLSSRGYDPCCGVLLQEPPSAEPTAEQLFFSADSDCIYFR